MEKIRVIANSWKTYSTSDPDCIALVVEGFGKNVELMIATGQVPAACAGMLIASQENVREMPLEKALFERDWNLENSKDLCPDAVDMRIEKDRLRIDVGSGFIFFRLTDTARQSLIKLLHGNLG